MNTPPSTLLRQVRILDPGANTDSIADVWIAQGVIKAIESHLETPSQTTVIEANGLILAPSLADLYSYSGEPGHEDRETLASLAAAAMAGGFTQVAVLPDTVPPIDNPATLAFLKQIAHLPLNSPHFHFWGTLTVKGEGKQMSQLRELAEAGIIGFTDNKAIENLGLLRRLLEYLKPLKKPIALVPDNPSLRGNGVIREGKASICYGLPGNPALNEASTIAAILEIAAEIGTSVHLMRVSTRRGVELIKRAKESSIAVTASVSWMHLLLDTEAIASYDPNLRLEPPLGNPDDRAALLEGVQQGIIDAIAIDHSPHTYEDKTVAFAEAPPGVIGLELALGLLWQQLIEKGNWTPLQLWQVLSLNPRRLLQQPFPSLKVGQPAELILFDPQKKWTCDRTSLKSLSVNTPWLGKQITGRVIQVWN